MKTAVKYVSVTMVVVKRPENPKTVGNNSWKQPKIREQQVFGHSLEHESSVVVNLHETPKQWVVAHENGHKT
jgi:hypothetical protein